MNEEIQKANDNEKRKEQHLIHQEVRQEISFCGPLPPPNILKQYDEVVPGAAERILKMAESQSEHRKKLESKVIQSDIYNSYLGQACAVVVALAGFLAAAYISTKGYPIAGGTIGLGVIGSLVYTFVYGTRMKREKLQSKGTNPDRK